MSITIAIHCKPCPISLYCRSTNDNLNKRERCVRGRKKGLARKEQNMTLLGGSGSQCWLRRNAAHMHVHREDGV